MASHPSSNDAMKTKELRFTQLDIKSSFTELPNLEKAISLIRERKLDPKVFGELTVFKDIKHGVVWCENNRRLYVLRKAGVPSVRVKFVNNDDMSRRIKEEDKIGLKNAAFLPSIKEEGKDSDNKMACNPPSNDGGRGVMKPEELRFTQLTIKPSFTQFPNVKDSISLIREGELDPKVFGELTVMRDKEKAGVVWCKNNRRLYVLRMTAIPSVTVNFVTKDSLISLRIKKDEVKKKLDDPAFLPRIRGQKPTSLLRLVGAASPSAADSDGDGDGDSEAEADIDNDSELDSDSDSDSEAEAEADKK